MGNGQQTAGTRVLAQRALGSRTSIAVLSLVLVAAIVGVTARAAIPGANDHVIHGCYQKNGGQLRVIDTAKETCRASELAIEWNQQGPQGAQGPQGREGPAGPPGPPAEGSDTTLPSGGGGGGTSGPPPPYIGMITPTFGPCSGGQQVDIVGSGFRGTTYVFFVGSGPHPTEWLFEVESDSLIHATTAANSSEACTEGVGLGEPGDLLVQTPVGMSDAVTYSYRTATTPARTDMEAALLQRMNNDRATWTSHPPAPLTRDACLDAAASQAAGIYRSQDTPPAVAPDQPPGCNVEILAQASGKGLTIDDIVNSPDWNPGAETSSYHTRVGIGVWGDGTGRLWAVVYFAH